MKEKYDLHDPSYTGTEPEARSHSARRLTGLFLVIMASLALPGTSTSQFQSQFYKPLDLGRAARQQYGASATVVRIGGHLHDWRAVVGGNHFSLDLSRAVRNQYGSGWTLAMTGVHANDWRAVKFSDLKRIVLPVMPIASDKFFDINGVRTGLTRFRSVLVATRNWYEKQVGSTFAVLEPLVIRTGRTSTQWNQLSANSVHAITRFDFFYAAIAEYNLSLPAPGADLRVIISPYVGYAPDVYLGAAALGSLAVAPQRSTSLNCPASGPLNARCQDATYAVGHELGHAFGLGHSCAYFSSDPRCSQSIMQSAKPPSAILLSQEIRQLVQSNFFAGSNIRFGAGCVGSAGWLSLRASGMPRIGHTQMFRLTNGVRGRLAMFSAGFSIDRFGSVVLPFDLGSLGAPGCWLYVDSVVWVPGVVGSNGLFDVSVAYPNVSAHVGTRFFAQCFGDDPQANRWGITSSNGVSTTIGN